MTRGRTFPLILLVGAACYRYTPTTTAAPVSGSAVRFHLTDAGAQSLSRVIGQNAVGIDGTVLTSDDTSFAVSMAATLQRDQSPLTWAGERVVIPRAAVRSVEARTIDRKRTLMVVGLGILGAIALKFIISGFSGSAGGDDGGITPPPP